MEVNAMLVMLVHGRPAWRPSHRPFASLVPRVQLQEVLLPHRHLLVLLAVQDLGHRLDRNIVQIAMRGRFLALLGLLHCLHAFPVILARGHLVDQLGATSAPLATEEYHVSSPFLRLRPLLIALVQARYELEIRSLA